MSRESISVPLLQVLGYHPKVDRLGGVLSYFSKGMDSLYVTQDSQSPAQAWATASELLALADDRGGSLISLH